MKEIKLKHGKYAILIRGTKDEDGFYYQIETNNRKLAEYLSNVLLDDYPILETDVIGEASWFKKKKKYVIKGMEIRGLHFDEKENPKLEQRLKVLAKGVREWLPDKKAVEDNRKAKERLRRNTILAYNAIVKLLTLRKKAILNSDIDEQTKELSVKEIDKYLERLKEDKEAILKKIDKLNEYDTRLATPILYADVQARIRRMIENALYFDSRGVSNFLLYQWDRGKLDREQLYPIGHTYGKMPLHVRVRELSKEAKPAPSVEAWVKHPNRYDIPGIDSPGKGWWGEPRRHSKAAKKGWRKRKMKEALRKRR